MRTHSANCRETARALRRDVRIMRVVPRFSLLSSSLLSFVFATSALSAPDTAPPAAILPEPADNAPLAFPLLEHYSKLWESSMFTTKSLPPPDDAPKGPIFTDNLTLAGIYEVDGALAGVILDRTTSMVTEVRVGVENEQGIKIARVNPGSTPDKTRLQLQKGDVAGWVSFASDAAAPAGQAVQGSPGPGPGGASGQGGVSPPVSQPGSAIPGRPVIPQPGSPSGAVPPVSRVMPGVIPGGPPGMRSQQAAASPPPGIPQSPVMPVTPAATSGDGDIPLPPQ